MDAADTIAFLTSTSVAGIMKNRAKNSGSLHDPATEYIENAISVTISAKPIPPAPTLVSFMAATCFSLSPEATIPSPKSTNPSK